MAAIISNGLIYAGGGGGSGNANVEYVTQEEYDALPDTKLTDNVLYFITDGVSEGLPEVVGDLLKTVTTQSDYTFATADNYFEIRPTDFPDETGDYKTVSLVGVEVATVEPLYLKGWNHIEDKWKFHIQNTGTGVTTKGVRFTWLMIRKDILALVRGG